MIDHFVKTVVKDGKRINKCLELVHGTGLCKNKKVNFINNRSDVKDSRIIHHSNISKNNTLIKELCLL